MCLRRIVDDGHEPAAVITRRRPTDGSLAELAAHLSVPVRAPEHANGSEFVTWLRSLKPDLNISMSYDQILKRPIIESAPLGFINCHAGKLPHYRGRNPINWAIINSETEIGITVHYLDEGIDTGDIVLLRVLPIGWEDYYGSVLNRVRDAFPDLLSEAMRLIGEDRVRRQPQPDLAGTYFAGRVTGDEWINWEDTSLNIYNKIRAISHPGPGARTLHEGRVLIIWKAWYDLSWPKYMATPGEVVGAVRGKGAKVKTGDSTLVLESVELEGEGEAPHVPKLRVGTRFGINLLDTVVQMQRQISEIRKAVRGQPTHS